MMTRAVDIAPVIVAPPAETWRMLSATSSRRDGLPRENLGQLIESLSQDTTD